MVAPNKILAQFDRVFNYSDSNFLSQGAFFCIIILGNLTFDRKKHNIYIEGATAYKVVDLRQVFKPTCTGQVTRQAYLFALVIPTVDVGKQCNEKRSEKNQQCQYFVCTHIHHLPSKREINRTLNTVTRKIYYHN